MTTPPRRGSRRILAAQICTFVAGWSPAVLVALPPGGRAGAPMPADSSALVTGATPAGPATTVPSDSNARSVYTQLCQNRLNGAKGKPVDLIFIGDSITQLWDGPGKAVWQKAYAQRHALNFGVGADTTQNVLWRLDHLDIRGFSPRVAVVLIGTNNFANTPADVAAGVKAVLDKTQQVYPGIRIILVSIMPNGRAHETMMQADEILKTFADNRNVYYLDLVPLMPARGQNWAGIGPDRLHPSAEGYQIWADAMEPLLKKLLPAAS